MLNLKLSRFLPYFILTALVVALFATNYRPGTWLTGWDNLHPEFDFQTNIIDRTIFSVWQEYQGLGVMAGNAHAADLLRQLFLAALSLITSPQLVRYVYHFIALWTGAIGAYEFIRRISLAKIQHSSQMALVGAAFYLLNLGTMQYFTVPYEAFSHFYTSFPWLLLSLMTYLSHPTRKRLGIFALISLLATPFAYIPTLFLVYLLFAGVIYIKFYLTEHTIKPVAQTLLVIICLNAFWLLPFANFVYYGTDFIAEGKINRLFTQEAFLRNQKFGGLPDVALLKGFLFDTTNLTDEAGATKYHFMLAPWMDFLTQPGVRIGYYLVFGLILVGYLTAVIRKIPHSRLFLVMFLLAIFPLINDNPPTGWLYNLLMQHVPLFKQVLRFPFTKFIVPAALLYAVGLSYGVWLVAHLTAKRKIHLVWLTGVATALLGLIIWLQLPSWQGHFFYAPMRLAIPQEYFELFAFMRKQDRGGRTANLPQPTFWGWTSYDWGYRGSGFPWYGLPQPIADRAFDVWNPYNEQYYADLISALYLNENPEAFTDFLNRYAIKYVWLDERIIAPHNPQLLLLPELKSRLGNPGDFQKIFVSGKQTVYEVTHQPISNSTSTDQYSFAPFAINRASSKSRIALSAGRLTAIVPDGELVIPAMSSLREAKIATVNLQPGRLRFNLIRPGLINNQNILNIPRESFEIPIPAGQQNPLIQINSSLVIDQQTPVILADINRLVIYDRAKKRTGSLHKFFTKELHNCFQVVDSAQSIFGVRNDTPGQITLFGTQSFPCVYAALGDVLPDGYTLPDTDRAILEFSFAYLSESDERPSVCLSKAGEANCFYRTDEAVTDANSGGWQKYTFQVPINGTRLKDIWLKLELAATDRQKQKQISYRDLTLNIYSQILTQQDFSRKPQPPVALPVNQGTLTVVLPNEYLKLTKTIRPALLQHERRNCFELSRGLFDRKVEHNANGDYVRYSAWDASSCDGFNLDYPLLKQGGYITLNTRNVSGRGLKVCAKFSATGICVVEDILQTKTNVWTQAYLISPAITTEATPQFILDIDNYAVGPEQRTNDLASISLTPIPVDWLEHLTVNHFGLNTLPDMDGQQLSFVQPQIRLTRHNPTLYEATIQSPGTDNSVFGELTNQTLVLNQSFHPGWKAWLLPPDCTKTSFARPGLAKLNLIKCKLTTIFPFFFGTELKNHILINNWANGWILSSNEVTNNEQTAILFFLPQLLEWIGFLLLPIPIIYIWRLKKHT